MLIARAPVRISLAGGGTDLPAYYKPYGGVVLNTTIDKYFYVFLNVLEKDTVQVTSSDYRTFYRHDGTGPLIWDANLRLPQTILEYFGVQRGLSLFLASEIPPGTGLGSSSTVAVAIIKALSIALRKEMSKAELAELACYIEIEKLGAPIGKQDQYAAAFGGFNWIEFTAKGVRVEPLMLSPAVVRQLDENLLLFFTGETRSASKILANQKKSSQRDDPAVIAALHKVKGMAYEVREAFERGPLDQFGELLHENWLQKQRFARGVSNPQIDAAYASARENGALGGKITGAGGGGFLMLYCQPEHHQAVTRALESQGLRRMDYHFESMGARVLMNSGLNIATP